MPLSGGYAWLRGGCGSGLTWPCGCLQLLVTEQCPQQRFLHLLHHVDGAHMLPLQMGRDELQIFVKVMTQGTIATLLDRE